MNIPKEWTGRRRIMEAVITHNEHPMFADRVAEAVRVENNPHSWLDDDVRDNYLACIIEGTISIGS